MPESRAARAAKREAAAAASKKDAEGASTKAKPEEEADTGSNSKKEEEPKEEVAAAAATKEAEEETKKEESKEEPAEESKKDDSSDKKDGDDAPPAVKKDAESEEKVAEDTKEEESKKEDETKEEEAKKEDESKEEETKKEDETKEEEAKKPEESKEHETKAKEEAPAAPAPAPPTAKPTPMEVDLPSTPTDRDVCIGDDTHKGTMVLIDLIRLHYLLLKKDKDKVEADDKAIDDLAGSLSQLMIKGKKYELSGLKDVPKSYLKRKGRVFAKKDDEWTILSDEDAKESVKTIIQAEFKAHDEAEDFPSADLKALVAQLFKNVHPSSKAKDDPAPHSAPRPCDVLFLSVDYPWEENMPYEHQSGNKHLLFLASQHVAADTNDSKKRVEAAFRLITSQVEVNSGTELVPKIPRYVIQQLVANQNTWREMEYVDLAEFAAIFVFEVYLEKQIHGIGGSVSSQVASLASDHSKPGTEPIGEPTEYDVLFGRGGMTNGHPGNRRFRDIIALHRPDYIRATKMDKPNVARRIVRAIRSGSPPGNFLKKGEDGKWYDVGDRCAAEKTSQGLRERSNAEKRQRSALREALRIRREDLEGPAAASGTTSNKKAKISDPSGMGQLGLSSVVPTYVGAQMNYAGGIPLSLSMKEKPKEPKAKKQKKGKEETPEEANKESLPPNAVDKDGNILVTDYDILCGRGGLTNHHQGNKRFRDIVALHRPDYVRAPKIQKPSVARVIVRAIRNGDPPGRFLKKDDKTGKWIDIGDKKAAEKTSQALREKTNESNDPTSATTTPFTSPTMVVPSPTANGTTKAATSKKAADKETKMGSAEKKAEKEGTSKKEKEAAKEESADAMDVDKPADDGNDEKKVDKDVEIAEV